MGKIRIQPYKMGSMSGKKLAVLTRGRRINLVRTRFVQKPRDIVVNWGSAHNLGFWYFNTPATVKVAQNKLDTLRVLQEAGVPVPRWTTEREIAAKWIKKGKTALARTLLRASAGRGIVVCGPGGSPLPAAPLYTRYVPKKDEYRVHVWKGEVIFVQQKRRRRGFETDNVALRNQIRNYDNGWVFCQQNIAAPPPVLTSAVAAVAALHLDFGAADVGWTENKQRATVYEVNTAPGLAGRTLTVYANKIRELAHAQMVR